MKLNEVMQSDVETVSPDTPVREVARRMRDGNIGFLPILDGETLVGVVTDRDVVLRSVAQSKDADTTPVRDIMSMEVVCCFDDESLEHAKAMMSDHRVRRLPVISRDHRLIGVVNMADVDREDPLRKKAVKVVFHKEKTDAYGRPHKVPLKTVYITGVKAKEEAEAKAIEQVERESGTSWRNIATDFESEEEPTDKTGTG